MLAGLTQNITFLQGNWKASMAWKHLVLQQTE